MDNNLAILTPVPYQVVQREGCDFQRQHAHAAGGPQLGDGLVPLRCSSPEGALAGNWRYRLLPTVSILDMSAVAWTAFSGEVSDGVLQATLRLPAGWHLLQIGYFEGEVLRASASVSPIGVGELFIVAGQSYAEGANEALLAVNDPQQRVVAYDVATQQWRVAHDPQPGRYPGGTIWPPVGDLLASLLRVPIGMVNVAVGATASRQWLPGEALYQHLETAGLALGRFRAVLWQQGESDVIEGVDAETYYRRLLTIRDTLATTWRFTPLWLPAKSTYHPSAYRNPDGEAIIRAAIDRCWHTPCFLPGPDTDILADENRADLAHMGHFSAAGQQRAALLWVMAIWHALME